MTRSPRIILVAMAVAAAGGASAQTPIPTGLPPWAEVAGLRLGMTEPAAMDALRAARRGWQIEELRLPGRLPGRTPPMAGGAMLEGAGVMIQAIPPGAGAGLEQMRLLFVAPAGVASPRAAGSGANAPDPRLRLVALQWTPPASLRAERERAFRAAAGPMTRSAAGSDFWHVPLPGSPLAPNQVCEPLAHHTPLAFNLQGNAWIFGLNETRSAVAAATPRPDGQPAVAMTLNGLALPGFGFVAVTRDYENCALIASVRESIGTISLTAPRWIWDMTGAAPASPPTVAAPGSAPGPAPGPLALRPGRGTLDAPDFSRVGLPADSGGIRLGMTLEEVNMAVEEIAAGRSYEMDGGVGFQPRNQRHPGFLPVGGPSRAITFPGPYPQLGSGASLETEAVRIRIFQRGDEPFEETLMLTARVGDGPRRVVAFSRSIVHGQRPVPTERVLAGLRQRYGEPRPAPRPDPAPQLLSWGSPAAGREACTVDRETEVTATHAATRGDGLRLLQSYRLSRSVSQAPLCDVLVTAQHWSGPGGLESVRISLVSPRWAEQLAIEQSLARAEASRAQAEQERQQMQQRGPGRL